MTSIIFKADLIHTLQSQLTRLMDDVPLEFDLTFITKYSPKHGIKVSTSSSVYSPLYSWHRLVPLALCSPLY